RRADVVHPDAELDRPGDPGDADVATDAVAEGVPRLRVLRQGPPVGRHGVRAAENRVSGDEARVAVGPRVAHAHIVVYRAARIEPLRRVACDPPGIADGRGEAPFHQAVHQRAVPRV